MCMCKCINVSSLMYSVIRMVLSTHYAVQLGMDTLNLSNTSSTSTSVMCTAKARCVCLLLYTV